MPTPELEGLLHFAIRNSNLTKLREMAENAQDSPSISFEDLIEALADTDRVFRTTVNRTLVLQDWETEAEFLAGFQFLEDYGDHLVDKGDLLHKMHALAPLLDWLVDFMPNTDALTPAVGERLALLLVEITQNREPTKDLVFSLKPDIVESIAQTVVSKHKCFDSTDSLDNLCAAKISAINALIGNNLDLHAQLDESVFARFADGLNNLPPGRATFARLVSTFRALTMESRQEAKWMHAVDLSRLVENSETQNVFFAQKIVGLVHRINSMVPRVGVAEKLTAAQNRLSRRCTDIYGPGDESCQDLIPSIDLDHSSEL